MKLYPLIKKLLTIICSSLIFIVQAQKQKDLTLILPISHLGGVYDAIFSPDYKFILTRDRFEIPRIWDAKTGYLLANLKGHNGRVYRMGYTNDGNKFFTGGSEDSTIFIWDTKTATKLFTFKTNGKTVQSGSFSLKGDRFLSAANDVRIWDMKTGKLLQILNPGRGGKFYETGASGFNKKGDIVYADYVQDSTFRYYWNANTGKLLAYACFNREAQKFELRESYISDNSFWDITTEQWQFPSLFPKQDKGLKFNLNHNEVTVMDSALQKEQYVISSHTDFTRLFYFLPDGNLVAEPNNRLYAGIWDFSSMQMKSTQYYIGIPRPYALSGEQNSNLVFNNNRLLGVMLGEDNFKVYNIDKREELTQFKQKAFAYKVKNAFFSDNDSLLVTVVYNGTEPVSLWQVSTGKRLRSFPFDENDFVTHTCFSNDNKWVALFGAKRFIRIYDIATGQLVKEIDKGTKDAMKDVFGGGISPDKTMLFFLDNDAIFKLFDIKTGKVMYELNREPGNYLTAAIFTPDSKQMVLGTSASINKVIDIPTHKMLYRFVQIDSTDYFTQTPDGYYQATTGATKLLHYVTKDLKVITFDQLDIKFNRPDKVLETIGNKDAAFIQSYHKAWQKRMKKLGVDTTLFKDDFSVPEFDFVNRDAVGYNQGNGNLALKMKGGDNAYNLDRFNIWVNDVPLFGLKGVSIKSRNKSLFDTTITIALSQGENRIEASVVSANGTESYRMPLFTKYSPSIPKRIKRHFIGFGINQFANPEYNLNWSVKDIRDLALKLKSKYPDMLIDTLFDKNLTKENMLALKNKLLQLDEDDIVMVSYSGHGVLSKDFDYYLSTYPINFNNPEDKGLAYDDLESLLDNVKPRQKLMLIDACHSGEVDKDEIAKIESTKKELSKNGIATKSTIKVVPKKNLGMANSFELMQKLFVNVGKGTGSTIISAAGGMQYAQERGDLKNGVFTYSIIESFNNNLKLKVSELKRLVGNRVLQLTNGLQKPTSRNETNNYDWIIW